MENLSEISLVHELLGKLYLVAVNLQDDKNYEKSDAIKDVLAVASELEELVEIFKND